MRFTKVVLYLQMQGVTECKYTNFCEKSEIYCRNIFGKCNLSVAKMMINTQKRIGSLSLEKVFSTICFLAGMAFFIAAILGLWRHFFTMGLCFAVGIMISEDQPKPAYNKKKRHEEK